MSDIEYESNNKAILERCCDVINAKTKPLTRKPGKHAVKIMAIDNCRDTLNMAKLCNTDDTSYFEEVFKSL